MYEKHIKDVLKTECFQTCIIYKEDKPTYETMMNEQIQEAINKKGSGDLEQLIIGNNSWKVA